MSNNTDFRFPFTEDEDSPDSLTFAPTPVVGNGQLGRRQSGYKPPALTPKQKAVVEAHDMQLLTICGRREVTKASSQCKVDMALNCADAYKEAVDWIVDQKNAITDSEKQLLYTAFAQQVLNTLPDALNHSLRVGVDEAATIEETGLSTLVSPPEFQEPVVEEEPVLVEEFVPMGLTDLFRGGKYVERPASSKRTGNRRRR